MILPMEAHTGFVGGQLPTVVATKNGLNMSPKWRQDGPNLAQDILEMASAWLQVDNRQPHGPGIYLK